MCRLALFVWHFTMDVEYSTDNGRYVVKSLPQTDSHRLSDRPIVSYPLSWSIKVRVHVGSVVMNRPPDVDEIAVMFIVKFTDLVVVV